MMGLGDIIEGKPPRDAYEYVVVVDDSGDPEDPDGLVIDLVDDRLRAVAGPS